jgi:hypothetical protein
MDFDNHISNIPLFCPSYIAKPNAELFGVIGKSGEVILLKESILIDDTFIQEAKEGRPAEERFRFAGKCVKNRCKHWVNDNQKCGLVEKLIHINNKPISQNLQECPIRVKCRWYAQDKELACANCTEVFRNSESQLSGTNNSNE